ALQVGPSGRCSAVHAICSDFHSVDELVLQRDEVANGLLLGRREGYLDHLVFFAIHCLAPNGGGAATFGYQADGIGSEEVINLLRHKRMDVAAVGTRNRLPYPVIVGEIGQQLLPVGVQAELAEVSSSSDQNARQVRAFEQNRASKPFPSQRPL